MKRDAWAIALVTSVSALVAVTNAAAEPSCAGTKWSVEHDAELIQAPQRAVVASGGTAVVGGAYTVTLVDLASAQLPQPPSKQPKQDASKAAFVRVAAPAKATTIQISASDPVWIDVVQDGRIVRSTAFSASHNCTSVHKSVRFSVEASPFVVEISGTQASSTAVAFTAVAP